MRIVGQLSVLAATALPLLAPATASAATVSAVHIFTAQDGFPVGPLAPLNGLLYGTSEEGIVNGTGTLFSVDPATGAEHDLYTFILDAKGKNDGSTPASGLTMLNGKLYGATLDGNGTQTTNEPYTGYGTIFAFDPTTNSEIQLHDFAGADGAQPSLKHDPLVAYQGALYGTAFYDGPNSRGAIYKVTPSGAFSLVYGFPTNASGCNPTGIAIVGGRLPGTTSGCGHFGGGKVFGPDPATGTQVVLHGFAGGSVPLGKPLITNGALIGVTEFGGADQGGSVYKIDLTSGAFTSLHSFPQNSNDGDQPAAGLTLRNGIIYGTTAFGPAEGIGGTVFTVDASTGAEATVATLTESTGYAPFGPLLSYDGALYGTTVDYELESSLQQGSVFKFTP